MTKDPRNDRASLSLFVALAASFVGVGWYVNHVQERAADARAAFAAQQLGARLEALVESHVAALQLLQSQADAQATPPEEAPFVASGERVTASFPGFLAVNWIDPSGVIRIVAPPAPNASAKGRNLLERADVRPFLEKARNDRRAIVTPVVQLYQGMPGFVVYMPIIQGGTFAGWLNGVFALDHFLTSALKDDRLADAVVEVTLPGAAIPFFSRGTRSGEPSVYEAMETINVRDQSWSLKLAVTREGERPARRAAAILLLLVGLGMSAAIAVLHLRAVRARNQLATSLTKEKRDNALLNLLSHDFANTTLIINAALAGAHRTPPVSPHIARIEAATARQVALMQRVRELRRAELGRVPIATQMTQIATMLQEVKQTFEAEAARKSLAINVEADGTPLAVHVDRVIFETAVLANLLSNAVKFSRPGGTITLAARAEESEVVVLVRDAGVGMSPELQASVFDAGEGVARQGTAGERGSGIGLMQVKTYVELFGGKIAVESKPEHGTTIVVRLPKVA